MKTFGSAKKAKSLDINITSLIDVIFMLVIFFMIGSTFEKPAFRVRLPEAESRDKAEAYPLAIAVDQEGNVFLDGRKVAPEELSAALAVIAARNPHIEAALDCDAGARFQWAAQVMDAVKKAGIYRLAVRYEYSP